MMALNIGPSAGMMGRMRSMGQRVGMARPRTPMQTPPQMKEGLLPPSGPRIPITSPVKGPIQGTQMPPGPPLPPGQVPWAREEPLPVGPPIPGPIDTAPREMPLPVGPPVMGPPEYTNPAQTNVPDMAMQQNIGQNIRKTGGIRGAYGGSAAGLAGGPFRRQMFY